MLKSTWRTPLAIDSSGDFQIKRNQTLMWCIYRFGINSHLIGFNNNPDEYTLLAMFLCVNAECLCIVCVYYPWLIYDGCNHIELCFHLVSLLLLWFRMVSGMNIVLYTIHILGLLWWGMGCIKSESYTLYYSSTFVYHSWNREINNIQYDEFLPCDSCLADPFCLNSGNDTWFCFAPSCLEKTNKQWLIEINDVEKSLRTQTRQSNEMGENIGNCELNTFTRESDSNGFVCKPIDLTNICRRLWIRLMVTNIEMFFVWHTQPFGKVFVFFDRLFVSSQTFISHRQKELQ